MVSTTSSSRALTVWVAPNSRAQSSFRLSVSTAMIRLAPTSAAPAMAASPTPPQPITATVSSRLTAPVLIAAPRPAITPQPSRPATAGSAAGSTLVHWPSCTSVLSANAPMPSAGVSFGAVGQRHLLRGVVRVEAVPRPAALACPALPAHRAPVQDHEVARLDVGHARADGLDRARGLMAEQERELVVDAALAVGQVGVAYPAGEDVDHHLTGSRVGDDDVHHLDWLRPSSGRSHLAPFGSWVKP